MIFPNLEDTVCEFEPYVSNQTVTHRRLLRLLMGQPFPDEFQDHPHLWFSIPRHLSFGFAYLGRVTLNLGQILTLWHRGHLQLPCECGGIIYLESIGGSPLSGSHCLSGYCPVCMRSQTPQLPSGKRVIDLVRVLSEGRRMNASNVPDWTWPFPISYATIHGQSPVSLVVDQAQVVRMTYRYSSDEILIHGEIIQGMDGLTDDLVLSRSPVSPSNDRWVERLSTVEPAMPLVSLAPMVRGNRRRPDPKIVKRERLIYQHGGFIGRCGLDPILYCDMPLPDHVLIRMTRWLVSQAHEEWTMTPAHLR
jgi:hypothetical protein